MQFKKVTELFILIAAGLISVQSAELLAKFGDIFKICSRSDPSIGQCIVDSLNGAREILAKGVPEFGLTPLSAFPIRFIEVNEGPGDFHLRGVIKNAKWMGIDTYNVTRATIDFNRSYIEFETLIPNTLIQGGYTFAGRLLTFRIEGDGTCDIELRGLNVTHRIDLKEETRDGETYWKISKYIFDMEMQFARVNYRNLFKGNKRLGSYANSLINNNWKIIYQIYGTLAKEAFGVPFMEYGNILLEKIPLKNLFSP